MSELAGKVAVVTGASKGIGKGIAIELARAGASVVVNYNSDAAGAKRVVDQIKSLGANAVAIQADVSKESDVKRMFLETLAEYGGVNILVNNAAVYSFGPLETLTEKEFYRQYSTNVWGVISTTREAIRLFGKAGGSIINIGGIISTNPYAEASLYAGTKAAVDVITLSLAREVAEKNVRINVIAPGATATEAAEHLEGDRKILVDKIISETPMKRLGRIEEIGRAVVFIASDKSAWITGESIRVGGGLR